MSGCEGNDSDATSADRNARGVKGAPKDGERSVSSHEVLRAALGQVRLDGAIFFRSEWTEGFAFESAPNDVAGVLHPGAERVILFHIVARGACWVDCGDGERHWARLGDVIVIPYGDPHVIGGEASVEPVSVLTLLDAPPWTEMPIVRHGGGGERTDLVCGYLYSDDPLFDPAMRVFPPAFVVHVPEGAASRWIEASIGYALEEASTSAVEPSVAATRLPELVLVEVLRLHLATAPAAGRGWLAALRDPVLAPALAVLHREPERNWTVAELASQAAVSRSLLSERFRTVLGRSPIRYLAEWRMHLAEELLAATDSSVFGVARRVGYDSEEAFSRAFKRARGLSPSHWRAAHASRSRGR